MKQSVNTNITFPFDLWNKAKKQALKKRISLAEIVRRGVALWLEANK